ncbi:protein phosphatase 2C domain-containing protein [Nocardia crassostreae]|uniref:protein phosphatase 2C domain-containing protein n=1 Tax=Nocardia crassostreae TaxID=53428 RepID=UPI00082CAF1F|nr:protein phosphatase 2C domain-containing protein [Nocardia crassostreae]
MTAGDQLRESSGATAELTELPSEAPQVGRLVTESGPPRLPGTPIALAGTRVDAGVLADHRLAAASLVGRAHLAQGTSAQDAYCFALAQDESALVLAVCDGVGSSPHTAQIGAELLVRLCCDRAAAITDVEARADAAAALGAAVADACRTLSDWRALLAPELTDRELHCAALVCRLPRDGGAAVFVRAGDCEAFLLSDGEFDAVFPECDTGPANVVRGVLPCPDPSSVLEFARCELGNAEALVLATDGLAGDLFDSPTVRDWLAERWAAPCGTAWMLDSLRYRAQGSHDDRTALVTWLPPRPERMREP